MVAQFLAIGGSKNDFIVLLYDKMLKKEENSALPLPLPAEEICSGSFRLDFNYLEEFMKKCFLAVGVPEPESSTSAEVLIEADKRGIDSHGIGRLKPIYFDRIAKGIMHPHAPISVVKETPSSALVDGHMGIGLYIGPYCMQLAIRKAKEFGVGFVVCQNSTHYGIAGYYATMATEQGCVGMTGTNARPSIAPTYGTQPCLGTNPLVFGVPSADAFPFVLDCATSINQRGNIEKYARAGADTPRGAVVDSMGRERTDSQGILRDMVSGECALCPMGGSGKDLGGHKGYGWATTVELLCTAFQSGLFGEDLSGVDCSSGEPVPRRMPLGHFFLAIDVGGLVDPDVFRRNVSRVLGYLRGSRKDPTGPGRIWTAGEPEWEARRERSAAGGVLVPPSLLRDMQQLRDSLPGLKELYPVFPFEGAEQEQERREGGAPSAPI